MVAAANPLATRAGYDILRAGGNAIDAAVAVQLVLGLVEPQSSGLGGGAFLLYHDARTKRLVAYDGRETAPAAAKPDRFLGADGQPLAFYDAVIGGRSVGVPGTVALLEMVHRRHGRLPWPRLFRRAIALAERGFPISPRLHALINAETHWSQARARDYFVASDGNARPIGFPLRNPAYARTLRVLAARGASAFYTGAIADDIVRTVRRRDPQSRRPDARRSRALPRQGACAGLRSVSRVSCLRHAAAVLGRAHGPAGAEDPRTVRPRVDGAGVVLERAFRQRGGAARVCRSRCLHGGPRFLPAARRAARRRIPASTLVADLDDAKPRRRAAGRSRAARGACARARMGPGCRGRVSVHVGHRDRRRRRQCGVDDDDDRGRIRQPADDRKRLPAQQRADRFLVRPGRERQARRQSRRAGQAAPFVDGADDRVRPGTARSRTRGLRRRQPDHRSRRQDADRHDRLEPRSAGGDRVAEFRQPQRPDGARARHVGRRLAAETATRSDTRRA